MKLIGKMMIFSVALMAVVGCEMKQPENWVAKVNRTYITQDDVEKQMKQYPPNVQAQLKDDQSTVVTQLINQELLYKEAQKEGLASNQTYIKQVDQLEQQFETAKRQLLTNLLIQEKVTKQLTVSPEEIQQFYQQNLSQFQAYEQRNASHILVKTGKEALKVYDKAIAKEDFAELAKKYSMDPTAQSGGNLGWFRKGQLVPEFEKAVFNLRRKGSISRIVKTQFGYHVIKLEGIKQIPEQKFDDIKPQIQQLLLNQKQSETLAGYVKKIEENHSITRKSDIDKKEIEQDKTISQASSSHSEDDSGQAH